MSGSFDTLEAARKLEAAGMDRQQAEAIAAIVRKRQGEPATKADITKLDTRIATLHDEMTTHRWIIGIGAATSMATLAAILAHAL